MAQPTGAGGGGAAEAQLERAELAKVRLDSFEAAPATVKTFGAARIAWSVTKPDSPFDIAIQLNGQPVAASGITSVSLIQSTTYALDAVTAHAARQLGQRTVRVDSSACMSHNFDPILIASPLKTQFDALFGGSGQFSLRGGGTTVTLGAGVIDIAAPLTIHVPDWFDAAMNVAIRLAVYGGAAVEVSAPTVTADVEWSFFANLASLECGQFIQRGMAQMAQAFLTEIVATQLVPQVRQTATSMIGSAIAMIEAADPQKRTFVLTLVALGTNGLTFTACPK